MHRILRIQKPSYDFITTEKKMNILESKDFVKPTFVSNLCDHHFTTTMHGAGTFNIRYIYRHRISRITN